MPPLARNCRASAAAAAGQRLENAVDPLLVRRRRLHAGLQHARQGRQSRLGETGRGLARLPATAPDGDAREGATVGAGAVLASTAYLVYLFKRGTFYPFAPTGHEQRSTEEEFRLRSLLADDLTVETDLDRWFPLWDLPVG